MKLLAVSTSSFTSTNREFYRRLAAQSINVHLVIPEFWNFGKGWVKADPKNTNDPKISFLRASNSHQRLYSLKDIKHIITQFSPDAIYYEGDPGSLMAAKLGIIAKKKKIKLLALSCENLSQNPLAVVKREGIKQLINACIKFALIRFSARRIHTLFVINKEGLAYFNSFGFKNVVQTPLGFNEQHFQINHSWRNSTRKQLHIESNTIVIAYFGRIVYEKGVHLLIEVLEKMEHGNWVFLIDNFGRYQNAYQEKIQRQIQASVLKDKTIFFEAEHGEIGKYMNAADITVLPSIPTKKWVEQYGRVVPEAMACGNRLIVSNIGAQVDFFESNYEYTYSPEDAEKLSQLLQRSILELKRKEFNPQKHSSRAIENYSLSSQIKIFEAALKKQSA